MTLNIINYLLGIVMLRISGDMPEKLINLCMAHGIFLWGITKYEGELYAWIRLPDYFRIRPLVRKSRSRVQVVGYHGLPFLVRRIKRRKMMVAGALMFVVLLNVLASYVWFVDVIGFKALSGGRILEVAHQCGLKPGVTKSSINTKALENALLLSIPEIAWVGVSFSGTRAVIEVVEKTLPKIEDKGPAHIVAVKDGIITEIIVLAGQPAIKKGDTVKKGDLLVKGFIPETVVQADPEKPQVISVLPQLIRAKSIVKARVWYETYGEAQLLNTSFIRTGKREIAVTLNVGSSSVVLKSASVQPFGLYETEVAHKKAAWWRNSNFAVESLITTYYELEPMVREITLEEARDEAKYKALSLTQELVPENAHILSRNIEILKTPEANLVRVKASIETEEDIGQYVNITQ